MVARLQPVEARSRSARAVASRFQLDITLNDGPDAGATRSFAMRDGDVRITLGRMAQSTPNWPV
jgi:hypothetical protein